MLFRKILVCFVALILSSCAGKDENANSPDSDISPEILYNSALDQIENGDFSDSAKSFGNLSREHPYSKWSNKAKLMEAYSLFKKRSYDEAISVIDSFIMLHPANEYVEYAFYLRALCYYYQISDVDREQKMSLFAKDAFIEIMTRFPKSKYATDARVKLDLINDHLAGKEMEIGRFYLKKGKLIAALNRFRVVIEKYDSTTHIAESLYRVVSIYHDMGLEAEAKKYAAVLGENYPASKWYRYSYDLVMKNGK